MQRRPRGQHAQSDRAARPARRHRRPQRRELLVECDDDIPAFFTEGVPRAPHGWSVEATDRLVERHVHPRAQVLDAVLCVLPAMVGHPEDGCRLETVGVRKSADGEQAVAEMQNGEKRIGRHWP